MKRRIDGSVQSGNIPTPSNVGRQYDDSLYRAMVTKVIFADDPSNITKNSENPRVLYDVVLLGGFEAGQTVSNCRLASSLGGNSNYYERVLKAATKNLTKTRLSDNDGDIVLVQFVQGHSGSPIIVALDNGIKTKDSIGATKEEGAINRWEYNGIYFEVNKDGEMTFKRKGGKYDSKENSFKPDADGDLVNYNVAGEKITIRFKSGLKITYSGEDDVVEIETKGGAKLTVDGAANEITLDSSKAHATGDLDVDGNASITGNESVAGNLDVSGTSQLGGGTPLLLATAQFIGTGNKGAPVISSVMSGQASKVRGA